jgi:hypothetical protein
LAFFTRLVVLRFAALPAAVFLVLEREAAARAAVFRRAVLAAVDLAARADFPIDRFAAPFLMVFRGALVAIPVLSVGREAGQPGPPSSVLRASTRGTISNGPANPTTGPRG